MKYSRWSKPKQERFCLTWLCFPEEREWMLSERDKKDFAGFENNLRSSGLVDFSNHFAVQNVVRRYFAGEHLYDSKQWGVFLYLNYRGVQTLLSRAMKKARVYDYSLAERSCFGLNAINPEMFYIAFTHDLEVVEVRA